MAKLIGNISSPIKAYNQFDELYARNKGRRSWSKYIQLVKNREGKYSVNVTASLSKTKGLQKQKKL